MGIFIISITAGIFFALLPTAAKSGKMVGNSNQASSLLQHKIDQLRGVGYGRLTYKELSNAGIIDASPAASPYSFVGVDGMSQLYKNPVATVTIADYNTEIKQVTVTITWSGVGVKQSNGTLVAAALIAKS